MKIGKFIIISIAFLIFATFFVGAVTNSNVDNLVVNYNLSVNGTTSYQGGLDFTGSNLTGINRVIGNSDNVGIGDAGDDSHSLTTDDDLFVSGKLEVDGLSYFDSNVASTGNITADNVWVKTYRFAHSGHNTTNPGANIWANATFSEEASSGEGINHDYSASNTAAFTINADGTYSIHYSLSYIDSDASPSGYIAMRLANNDVEIPGSLWQKDTTMQNKIGTLQHTVSAELNSTQNLTVQWASDVTTISLKSWTDLGDHADTSTISITRVG